MSFSKWVVACAVVLGSATVGSAKTYDVPGDFATIQAAIEAASSGDSIDIEAGTYHENVIVDKTLRIRADSDSKLVAASDTEPAVSITADEVELRNLQIEGGSEGVYVENTTDVELDRLDISFAVNEGIFLTTNQRCRVHQCTVSQCDGSGIYAIGDHESLIERNDVLMNSGAGIVVLETRDVTIERNLAVGNNAGIGSVETAVGTVVEQNEASQNVIDGFFFIRTVATAMDNESLDNGANGYYCNDESSCVFIGNRSESNLLSGYYVAGSAHEYLGNEADDNGSHGFEFCLGTGTFDSNHARGNAGTGFYIGELSADGLYVNNVSQRNGGNGFETTEYADNNTLRGNAAERNDGYGFVDAGNGNVFENNTCRGNDAGPSLPEGLCDEE